MTANTAKIINLEALTNLVCMLDLLNTVDTIVSRSHLKINKQIFRAFASLNLELVEVLREIGLRHRATAGEVAIAWTLHN